MVLGTPGFRMVGSGKPRCVEVRAEASTTPVVNWGGFDDGDRPKEEHASNGRLIVTAVNLLPALAAVVDMARQVRSCDPMVLGECNRELDNALSALDEAVAKEQKR